VPDASVVAFNRSTTLTLCQLSDLRHSTETSASETDWLLRESRTMPLALGQIGPQLDTNRARATIDLTALTSSCPTIWRFSGGAQRRPLQPRVGRNLCMAGYPRRQCNEGGKCGKQ
jgi:hypothetical protein